MKDKINNKTPQETDSKQLCPLVYDKINLDELNKKAKPTDINQYFYDKISKKFIHIFEEGLFIYNSNCKKVKAAFPIKIGRDKINNVAVDKQVTFMLILTEAKDGLKLIFGVKIKTESVIGMIKNKEPLDFLLGMFFINNYEPLSNEKNTIKDFCLVFPQRIKIYTVDPVTDLLNEIISVNQTNTLNTNFHYNLKCSVLCCEKANFSLSLHNLSQQAFYKNEHNIKLPSRDLLRKTLSAIFGTKDEKKECKKIIQTLSTKVLKYKRFQIFLEVISFHLYLINFSFEENKLFIYSIVNLDTLELKYEIDIKNHSYYSTVQFIDNLLVVYNFFRKETIIYDIGSIKGNTQYAINNTEMSYDKELLIEGKMIIKKSTKTTDPPVFHYVSFSKTILFDMTPPELKHIAVISLFQRKKSKSIIFGYLRQMILSHYKMKYLRMIYMHYIKQLQIISIEESTIVENDNNNKSPLLKSSDIIKPTDFMFIGQNCTIKQGDIMLELFKTFDKETGIEELVIDNMIVFYHCLVNKNIQVLPCFHIILNMFIRKLSTEKLLLLLQNDYLPESYELAKYVMEIQTKEPKHQRMLEQYGLDILIKLGKVEDAFAYLYQQNRLDEAIMLLMSKNPQSDNIFDERINEIIANRSDLMEQNADLLLQYFNVQFI